ncbi:MAG: autotransporter-associated beta strand repeat-containing protein [Caulobacteraceae bacterium]|nr:autotransporter-associated beta strand repeat-containing protein [Caulobacteraceae bacterium]
MAARVSTRLESTQPRALGRRRALWLATTVLIGLGAGGAEAADWTGTAGDLNWSTAANWNPATVPTASTAVTINNGSTASPVVISSAGAVASGVDVGSTAGTTGALSVTGAGALTVTNSAYLTVGDYGAGTLTVSGGGHVTSTVSILANNGGSSGTATVTGAGSQWTAGYLYLAADNAVANLTVSAGGTLTALTGMDIADFAAGGSGTLTVTGAGSSFVEGGSLFVIGAMGSGTFDVFNGATASTYSTLLSNHTSSQGTAVVSGAGSQWTITGAFNPYALSIGGSTVGSSLSVLSGGRVVVAQTATVTNNADVMIGSGSTVNGAASLTVDGAGSTFTTPYRFDVGYSNTARGTVTVSNGGALNTGFSVIGDGFYSTANGAVTVTGSGSIWTIADTAQAAVNDAQGLVIGQAGTGVLTIANGATVQLTNAASNVLIGGVSGSSGTLNIGAPAGSAAIAPGTLNASKVIFSTTSPGPLAINFNHTSSAYLFAPQITGSGPGAVNFLSGVTIFTADDTYTGSTTISSGATLQLGNGGSTGSVSTNIVDNGALAINRSGSYVQYNKVLSGSGALTLNGGLNLVLGGDSSAFAGTLTIHSATLNIGAGAALGDATATSGGVAADIGALAADTGAFAVYGTGAHWTINSADGLTVGDAGRGSLTVSSGGTVSDGYAMIASQTGSTGSVVVGGTNATWTNAGALDIGLGGSGSFVVGSGATASDTTAQVGGASGSSGVAKVTSGGTWTNSGAITIAAQAGSTGLVEIGGASTASAPGSLTASAIVFGAGAGTLDFNHTSTNYVFATPITESAAGTGTVSVRSGVTHLTGASTYTGATNVLGGTLDVDGSLGQTAVSVASGASLGGSGSIAGAVTVASGGVLLGTAGQTLTMGSLVLGAGAVVDVSLGAPSSTRLFNVASALTLNGTLNVTDLGGFGVGVYRLIDYSGALSGSNLAVGLVPTGDTGYVQTSIANQVNLVVSLSGGTTPTIQFWNGSTTIPNGTVVGGSGTWSAGAQTNWTDAAGDRADPWGGAFAVFQGSHTATTTVRVDGAAGAVSATGMQFTGANWLVRGDPITLAGAGGSTTIRVGDGSAAGATDSVTIASALIGASSLVKTDLGTLILTGANTYSGGTTISSGTLQIGGGGTSGSISGAVTNNAALVFDRSDALTFAGAISGTGSLTKQGAGVLTLTGAATYIGSTAIQAGALRGGAANVFAAGSAFTVASGATLDLGGYAQSVASLTGAGVVTSTGTTSSTAATLTLDGGASATFSGQIKDGDSPVALRLAASGGTLTLTGTDNTFSGGLSWGAGETIAIDNAHALGTGALTMLAGSTLAFTGSGYTLANAFVFGPAGDPTINTGAGTITLSGVISQSGGTGSLSKTGTGTLILQGANTYTGLTDIAAGTLVIGASSGSSAQVAGGVQVDSGATLGGYGHIGGNLTNLGLVSPGDPTGAAVGALTVGGTYAQGASANLLIAVTPAVASALNVTGTATLTSGATVTFAYAPGTYASKTYAFLHSGSLTGTFTTVAASATAPLPTGALQSVSYTATDADLVLTVAPSLTVSPLDARIFGAQAFAFAQTNQDAVSALTGRAAPDGSSGRGRAWAEVNASTLAANSNGARPGFNADTGGLRGGGDVEIGGGNRAGLALAYDRTTLHDRAGGEAAADIFRASLYAYQPIGPIAFTEVVSYAKAWDKTSRATGAGIAEASFASDALTGAVQVSAPLTAYGLSITPAIGVQVSRLTFGQFSETDALAPDFAVSGSGRAVTITSPYATLGLSKELKAPGGVTVIPDIDIGYRRDQGASGAAFRLSAADATVFDGDHAGLAGDAALLGVSLTAHRGQWSAFAKYRAQATRDWTEQGGAIGLRLAF